MAGVSFAAHRIVDNFGALGGWVVLAVIFAAAHLYDKRERRAAGISKESGASNARIVEF
jgi:hypothetical protein